MLTRILEPEVMDTPDEAAAYDAMDHSEPNAAFVQRLVDPAARPGSNAAGVEGQTRHDFVLVAFALTRPTHFAAKFCFAHQYARKPADAASSPLRRDSSPQTLTADYVCNILQP
jgi:hypothetical protein